MPKTKKNLRILLLFSVFFIFGSAQAAGVEISEVAWMGTSESAQNEWIELYSSSGANLEGWWLVAADGGMSISLSGAISQGGYFLIERTDDNTVPTVSADLVSPFGNGLNNNGEHLILKDSSDYVVDSIDFSAGWPAGDNSTKETMQKSSSGTWITAAGTPQAANYEATPPPPPPSPSPSPPPNPPPPPPPSPAPSPSPAPAPIPPPSSPPPASPDASQGGPSNPNPTPTEGANPTEVTPQQIGETQTAQSSQPFFSKSSWLWLLSALGIGILAALGYLVSKRI